MWPIHLLFSIVLGGHLGLQSLSTSSSESHTEIMFLKIDEGLQSFSLRKCYHGFFFFFFNWSQLSLGNLIAEEIKLKLCLQVHDYSAGRGIRWAGWTSFIFVRSWLTSINLSEMSLLFYWYNWEQIWPWFSSFTEGWPEILLPKSLRLEKISRHSLSLCCFTSAKKWVLEPSKMKLGNLLWQVVLSKIVDISKVVHRGFFIFFAQSLSSYSIKTKFRLT